MRPSDGEKTPAATAALPDVGKVLITPVGLRFPESLRFDDWEQAGRRLAQILTTSRWCLGDWAAYGERTYTDRYKRAIESSGLDYQTLRNYVWVSRRFEPSRRRPDLSFQHHAEVASLPIAEQERWLDLAERHRWSRNQLRGNLQQERRKRDLNQVAPAVVPRITATGTRLERWHLAAERSGHTLEDWMLTCLDHAAARALGDEENGVTALETPAAA